MNFKKFSGKITAVAATMAIVASMSAVSVSAADYAENTSPVTPAPAETASVVVSMPEGAGQVSSTKVESNDSDSTQDSDDSIPEDSDTVQEDVSYDTVVSDVGTVFDQLSGSVEAITIDSTSPINITADAIQDIIANGSLTVEVTATGENAVSYAVTIDADDITSTDSALNIAMDISKSKVGSINGVKINKSAVVISPNASGDIGAAVKVSLPKSAFSGVNLKKVKLYRIDKDGNITEAEGLTVSKDGTVTIEISDGSYDYVISDKNLIKGAKSASKAAAATKAKGAVPGSGKGVAALGLIDASAVSIAAILAKKKKKK